MSTGLSNVPCTSSRDRSLSGPLWPPADNGERERVARASSFLFEDSGGDLPGHADSSSRTITPGISVRVVHWRGSAVPGRSV